MASEISNSVQALAKAILDELARAETNPQHSRICISHNTKSLPNGIRRYSVQIECNAGCGWLIEACEEESEALEQKVAAIQRTLTGTYYKAPNSLAEILFTVFPEFIIGKQAAVPKGAKESSLGGS